MKFSGCCKLIAVLSVFSLLAFDVCGAETAKAAVQKQECVEADSCCCEKNLYNMGRGLVNVATCWLEIPRCFVYHNSQVPVMGTVVGVCEGVGFTTVRAFAGVADFISLGFMTDSIYLCNHEFKEWVWASRWLPKE